MRILPAVYTALAVLTLMLLAACGEESGEPMSDVVEPPEDMSPQVCFPPETTGGRPASIEAVVEHINELPRPVTIPCFLESLERPISVWATWNTFSAQPAVSPLDPRIFIFEGDLVLSVVTAGDGRPLLEMSDRTSAETSIKAEILFPVEEPLALADAFNRIGDANGTECGFCHLQGTRIEIDGAFAFDSEFIPGSEAKQVDLPYLMDTWRRCDRASDPERCRMFDSILGRGDFVEGTWD